MGKTGNGSGGEKGVGSRIREDGAILDCFSTSLGGMRG
jgi:hypothetical protein